MRKMRNIKHISQLAAFIMLLMLTSCGKDFLEIDYYDIVDPDVMMQTEDGINKGLIGCYDALYGIKGVGDKDWYFKPHIQLADMPALDCQAGGWDANFSRFAWKADDAFFIIPWKQSYIAIDRVNRFLDKLKDVDPKIFEGGQTTKDQIEAEARTIRAYNYYYLAINFGRLPMLETGETYGNTPAKPRAESMDEVWDFIINDFEYAIEKLDWKPRNNQGGRVTKGMAKAYVAKVYMYKKDWEKAKKHLQDIVNSGEYQLEPVFGAIHSESYRWGKESVWEVAHPDFENMFWGANNTYDAVWWPVWNMKWGSLFISHEWIHSFEPGDRRLRYSAFTYKEKNPYTGQVAPFDRGKPYAQGGSVPNNYCLKFWKRKQGSNKKVFYSMSAILMRYAEVLLNLSECKFETGEDGWGEINQIRNRAWGNLEVGVTTEELPEQYPDSIPRLPNIVPVPDAQDYYTQYKAAKGYTSPVWKVALIQERRHEFNSEYSLYYDLTRMGVAKEYLDIEYPVGGRTDLPPELGLGTNRQVQYDDHFSLFPIPYDEIITNEGISQDDQNPGY